jgi:hypothetical protein
MLEAAGGGGGTAWELMTVETMYQVIHSADTGKQWDIVGGWQKSAELINEHQFQVKDYRDNLAAVWPPKKSAAAAAYLDRLDQLIANLKETYEATLANHDALSSATGSIYQAQTQMDKIYQEYTNNETLLAQQTTTQQSSGSTPTPAPSPSGEEPLVAPGRQEQLRQQAITLLSSVSSDLAAAQLKIVTPALYKSVPSSEEKTTANNGTTYVAPAIPFVTPSYSDSGTKKSTLTSTTFPTTPTSTAPITTHPSTGNQPGLVLGGTTTPVVTSPSTGITAPIPSGASGPSSTPGLFPPSSGFTSGGSSITSPREQALGMPREGALRPGAGLPQEMRMMPPGGVIGGMPGMGAGQPGRGVARRINPVGGVIGENEGARGAGAQSTMGEPYGQAGGRRPGRRTDTGGEHWDPDNPWETAEGVDPVVMPARERRIDPGPAIGLG